MDFEEAGRPDLFHLLHGLHGTRVAPVEVLEPRRRPQVHDRQGSWLSGSARDFHK